MRSPYFLSAGLIEDLIQFFLLNPLKSSVVCDECDINITSDRRQPSGEIVVTKLRPGQRKRSGVSWHADVVRACCQRVPSSQGYRGESAPLIQHCATSR